MNKAFKTIAALALLVAMAVSCRQAFVGTDVPAADLTALSESANAISADPLVVVGISDSITIPDNMAIIEVTVANGKVDESSLGAISFYNLLETASADGAHARDNSLTYSSRVLVYYASMNSSVIYYTFDMSTAANFSPLIEAFVDPAVLTANGGTKRMDIDGDGVQGEPQDDDAVEYVEVDGGTKVPDVLGYDKDPRAKFTFSPSMAPLTVGQTTFVLTYSHAVVDDTDYLALANAAVTIQKFNGSAWADLTPTNTAYNRTNGQYTVTCPATAARENYRIRYNYSAGYVTAKPVRGYRLKGSYEQGETVGYTLSISTPDTPATYNTGLGIEYYFSCDENNRNVAIDAYFNGVGAQGLSGVDATTIRLFRESTRSFLPVVNVIKVTPDWYQFVLQPAYALSGTITDDIIDFYVSPSVIDLGDTTDAADDLKCGDYTNVETLPFGWNIVDGTNGL